MITPRSWRGRESQRGRRVVVNRELPDVGWLGERKVTEILDGWHEPALDELVEGVAAVPEVEDAPAPVDRAGRVEDQPAWWPVLDVEVIVDCDVLLLGSSGKPNPQSDSHCRSFRWACRASLLRRRGSGPGARRPRRGPAGPEYAWAGVGWGPRWGRPTLGGPSRNAWYRIPTDRRAHMAYERIRA